MNFKAGDVVKLKGYLDPILGTCHYLAEEHGVDLNTELTVESVKEVCGLSMLYFESPYEGFSGMLETRFIKA